MSGLDRRKYSNRTIASEQLLRRCIGKVWIHFDAAISLGCALKHKMQPLCPTSRVPIKAIWLQFSFENPCSFPQNLPFPLAGHTS